MSNQGARQQSVRDQTGTAWTYEGDWHALFDLDGIAGDAFNDRMLGWINVQLGTSYDEINGAMNAYAVNQGAADWSGLGTMASLNNERVTEDGAQRMTEAGDIRVTEAG